MSIDLIGGTSSSTLQGVDLRAQTLGQQDLLNIMLTQLQFQDPLKPMDNQQFLAQMAQFSSLAQTAQMNDRIDTLLTVQAAIQAIGLIGKTVQVNTTNTSSVGTVSSISFSSGSPRLTVAGSNGSIMTGVSVSQITVVR